MSGLLAGEQRGSRALLQRGLPEVSQQWHRRPAPKHHEEPRLEFGHLEEISGNYF